jgi:hypothetical protein
MNISMVSLVLLAVMFTLIGAMSATHSTATDKSQNSIVTDTSHSMRDDLPFYSSSFMFIVMTFATMSLITAVKNCVIYSRYGVLHFNQFFNENGSMKVGALLLSIFAGEFFFTSLMTTFYT